MKEKNTQTGSNMGSITSSYGTTDVNKYPNIDNPIGSIGSNYTIYNTTTDIINDYVSYSWNPLEDITIFELSVAIPYITTLRYSTTTVSEFCLLPDNVRRHFEVLSHCKEMVDEELKKNKLKEFLNDDKCDSNG